MELPETTQHPPLKREIRLLPALRWLVGEMEKEYQIRVELSGTGNEKRFSADAELLIFRIVQEALRNVGRHAKASAAEVALDFKDGKTRVSVVNNGKGFEFPAHLEDLSRTGRLGLAGIEERARLIGGRLSLQSRLGEGTKVVVEVPLQ